MGSDWLSPPEWWKKYKPLRWVAAGGVVFFLFSTFYVAKVIIAPSPHEETDRFTERAANPVLLLDGMRSYDTLDSARALLDAAKVTYTVTPMHPRASPKYPPRNRDTLVAAQYRHLGVPGELTLEFFNDRLYEATFIPAEPFDYVDKLHANETRFKPDRTGRSEQVIGPLRVASNVAFAVTDVGRSLATKPYVIWQDRRLVSQLDEWDRRFVALPRN